MLPLWSPVASTVLSGLNVTASTPTLPGSVRVAMLRTVTPGFAAPP